MKVCFVVSEIFAFGKFGGFGKLVRDIGSELAKRGVEVSAITWREENQREVENVGDIKVYSYPYDPKEGIHSRLRGYLKSRYCFRRADADVYLSIEYNLVSLVGQKTLPKRTHALWFQDPYDKEAFRKMDEVGVINWNNKRKLRFYLTKSILRKFSDSFDLFLTQANTFRPKIEKLYGISRDEVRFFPNPVKIPKREIQKARNPTVCFLGRWDPQKRVEIFLKLAKRFPEVDFIAMGKGHNEKFDKRMRSKYSDIDNLEMPGFVSEREKSRILEKSWVLANTSIREGLPISFLEASAHKTAILSYVNPDNFAGNFGYWAHDEDFIEGLNTLLKDKCWREKGEKGYEHVRKVHNITRVAERIENTIRSVEGDSS